MRTREATTHTALVDVTPGPTGWHQGVRRWWGAVYAVLPVFCLTRMIFLLLTYFGGVLFSVPNYWTGHLDGRDVFAMWYRWDALRFATIAEKGYVSVKDAAFFPLYPTLEHVVGFSLDLNVLLAGMLIANLAFFGTLVVFYRLVESEFDGEIAKRAVLYISIFPTALFFFAGYNESLFLLFLLLSIYAMRCGSWWLAGLCAGLATLTRSMGAFLALIFVCEFVRQMWPHVHHAWHTRRMLQIVRLLSRLLALLCVPLALGIYAYYLGKRLGDPLAFLHAEAIWHEPLSFPWVAPLTGVKSLFHQSLFTFASPHIIIELSVLMLFLVLLILCFVGPERLATHQWTFVLFGLLALLLGILFPGIPSAPGVPYDPLPSLQRYVLEIFVGFIILARLGRRPWFHQAYLLLSLPMLAFLTLQFLTGHWTV